MQNLRDYLLIACLGALLFFPFLGQSHLFDWDEINFAEASREMVVTGNYTQTQIDFRQFWEKPPFFFWLQAGSMHLFGINEYAARFPNAVCGILTLILLFAIGTFHYDRRMGWWWVLCYAGSILPQFYFKSGIIDPWFNLFIFLGIYGFIRYLEQNRSLKWLVISALGAGLSVLTKGPVGVALVGLTVGIYYITTRFRQFPPIWHLLLYIICLALPIMPWVAVEVSKNGTWFIQEFFTYQTRLATTEDASHGGFPGYHFVVLLFFCFPASTFAIGNMAVKQHRTPQLQTMRKWMLILFWVVLIVFSIVQTKIAHYSSMAYFPLTFLAALRIREMVKPTKLEVILLCITGITIGICMIALPIVLQHPDALLPYMQDIFTQQAIYADGLWMGWEWILGVISIIIITIIAIIARKRSADLVMSALFVSVMIIINIAITIITPKIERYSQGAMIDFLEEKSQESCYTEIIGFKSYAHLFYGQRKLEDTTNPLYMKWIKEQHPDTTVLTPLDYRKLYGQWLMYGEIDKPAYLITNARKKDFLEVRTDISLVESKNGYYFYVRQPVKQP